MSIADYLEDGADYYEAYNEEYEMCGNENCEYNEDGCCMKDEYCADCPFED